MQVVKDIRAFDPPRQRLTSFFARGDLHFPADLHLCFVCGAADRPASEPPSLRRRFLNWAADHEPRLVCVQAESAVTDLLRQVDERRASRDLSIIESTIAQTVDSLLLFPESPGSFAELGLFSANEEVSQKMLVAVQHEYQGDSFIILGPVKQINARSAYSPQPIVVAEPAEASFQQIRDRLLGELCRTSGYSRRYSTGNWKDYSLRDRLAIADKIIDLVGISTEDDLFDHINRSFGSYEKSDIRLLVALLTAMGRAARTEMGDIVRVYAGAKTPFISGGGDDAIDVKASWTETYRDHIPTAIDISERFNR